MTTSLQRCGPTWVSRVLPRVLPLPAYEDVQVPGRHSVIGAMPEISRFFGIVIKMFYNDHLPAHFHAEYGEHEALIEIGTLAVYRGDLPRRALALVLEWAALHRAQLERDWELARTGQTPERIAPLD